ncbi:MAG: ParB/RepB/Spo0J family partition protein [Rickettsiaceae bacterium]|nr:MAG: ParB/RepB/Spo0J family partition protein [Rickettsiaceae bacterium]
MMKNRGLGRGLSALLKEQIIPSFDNEIIKIIDIDKIEAGEFQPRKKFEADKVQELANSISNDGLLQPLIVTVHPNNHNRYRLVAGERRWRACKLVNILEVPVIIKNYNNDEILRVSLLENIQREELTAIEEAEGYIQLIKHFQYTQEDLGHKLGKSRSHIANLVRLTSLPDNIKDKINEGQLSMGHARCLVGHKECQLIANHIIENNLNVRQTEKLVRGWAKRKNSDQQKLIEPKNKIVQPNQLNADLELLAASLSEKLDTKVNIDNSEEGGCLVLHYQNLKQLDLILSRIN